jgi:hypothetical protein
MVAHNRKDWFVAMQSITTFKLDVQLTHKIIGNKMFFYQNERTPNASKWNQIDHGTKTWNDYKE